MCVIEHRGLKPISQGTPDELAPVPPSQEAQSSMSCGPRTSCVAPAAPQVMLQSPRSMLYAHYVLFGRRFLRCLQRSLEGIKLSMKDSRRRRRRRRRV